MREHAPQAEIVIDNDHVVPLATTALDEVRREHGNELRAAGAGDAAKAFKDARWSLLKNPEDLTDRPAATLAALQTAGGKVPRAWAHKETVREIFKPGLSVAAVEKLIDRVLARLSRSRLPPFVRLGRTIRKHKDGILAARRPGVEQRSRGSAEQQGEADRSPRLRIPLRPRRACAHPPHLRPDRTHASTRTNCQVTSPTIIHGEPEIVDRGQRAE